MTLFTEAIFFPIVNVCFLIVPFSCLKICHYFQCNSKHFGNYVISVYLGSMLLIQTINVKDPYHTHFLCSKYQNN